ncbi:minor capsid protein [Peptoniphilus sp. SGI.035]|uniref:minor capsid protein n=1 Tax=Peptoniphilus sp. SGI.035 TaxID=3420564 RepID=UPI003D08790E
MTEYWKNRFLKSTKDIFDSNDKYVAEIFRMYKRASESIDRDILSILNSMNQVSMSEAKKLLNKKEIKGLKNNLEDFMNASKGFITPDIERELDLISRRVRISKLQGMQLSLKSKVAVLLNEEQKKLFAHLSNQYVSSYYKDLYGLQRITGYKNINKLSKDFVEEVLNASWANDGKNFSDRIWKRKDKLISSLDTDLRQGLIIGKSPDKITKAIADKLEVSKNNAKRLVQTESAAIHSGSRKLMYERMGVEKYEILATLDTRTSDICRGLDGKVFEVKDYERGITAPPFHVNCYDKKTEVLTNNGWKYFKDIENEDYVYTLNLDTKIPKWQKPIKLINYKYKGKMIKYSSDRFDLLVTPNHNMLVQNMASSFKDKSYKLRQANKIGIKSKNRIPCGIDWVGESKETIELVGKELDIKTYLKFMAYWLSDGSVTKDKGRYKIKIAQCKNDWMWNELKKLPFKKYKCKESILVENNELGEELTKFGKCNKKYIPSIIKTLDRDLIIFFLKEYAKCDGTIKKGKFWKGYQFNDSTSFFTTSNQLAADLGELILKAGGRPSYSLNKCSGNKVKFSNGTYTLNYDVWTIYWNKQIYSWICYMNVDKSFYYDDFVYCVEVPEYNTLYVRRNGKCCWSGNCRTTTVPYFDDDIQKEIENTRMARDVESGKSVRVEDISYKEWFDKYVKAPKDEEEYNNIVNILGYKVVGNLEKYKDIKYNDGARYKQINREVNTMCMIDEKDWAGSYKEKIKDLYYEFREKGHELSMHGLERTHKRILKGKFTKDEVLEVLNKDFNKRQIVDDRPVKFYNNIQAVYLDDEIEILNVLYRGKNWKEDEKLYDYNK